METLWKNVRGTLSNYISEWAESVEDYQYSIQRLTSLVENSTGATKEQINWLVQQAEALEKVWVATKDNIVAWMSQFATFDMSTDAISQLTEAYVDYVVAEKWATASSEDYISMANGLAQALQGNYASLTRSWFILDEETKALIENGDEMERVTAITEVLNSTYRWFNKTASETAKGQRILLQRAFGDIRDTIASAVLPAINNLLQAILPVVQSIADFAAENPKLTATLVWVVWGLSWLMVVAWTIWGAIGPLSAWFSWLSKIVWAVWSWLSMLPSIWSAIWPVFSALAWPIWIVVAALAALWVAYATNFWWFRDFVNEVWAELQPIFEEIWVVIKEVFEEIRAVIQEVWTELQPVFEEIMEVVVEVFRTIWDVIKEVWDALEPILTPIWENFGEVLKFVLIAAAELVKSSFQAMGESIKAIIETFRWVIDFLQNVFSWNWQWALDSLKWIAQTRYNAIINIFKAFNIDLPGIIETLKNTATSLWNGMFNGLKNICSSAIDWMSNKISRIWDKIQAAKDAIASLWGGGSSWSRASGWLVLAGQTYRVNEIHWEYFTPMVNGMVTPAPATTNAPNLSINFTGDINVRNQDDINNFSEKVREVILDVYKNLATWTY